MAFARARVGGLPDLDRYVIRESLASRMLQVATLTGHLVGKTTEFTSRPAEEAVKRSKDGI